MEDMRAELKPCRMSGKEKKDDWGLRGVIFPKNMVNNVGIGRLYDINV